MRNTHVIFSYLQNIFRLTDVSAILTFASEYLS